MDIDTSNIMEDTTINVSAWSHLFLECESNYYGYCASYKDACKIIELNEVCTNSRFVARAIAHKGFGTFDLSMLKKFRIRFEDCNVVKPINLDGMAFIISNSKTLRCSRGPNCTSKKIQNQDQSKEKEVTMKVNCPAIISLREVIVFPGYKVVKNSQSRKKKMSSELRSEIKKNPENVTFEYRIYIQLPHPEMHEYHNVKNKWDDFDRIHKRLVVKIEDLVNNGIDKTMDVQHHLRNFVCENYAKWFKMEFLPSPKNRRFFPTAKTIRNHISIILKNRNSGNTLYRNLTCLNIDPSVTAELENIIQGNVPSIQEEIQIEENNINDSEAANSKTRNSGNTLYRNLTCLNIDTSVTAELENIIQGNVPSIQEEIQIEENNINDSKAANGKEEILDSSLLSSISVGLKTINSLLYSIDNNSMLQTINTKVKELQQYIFNEAYQSRSFPSVQKYKRHTRKSLNTGTTKRKNLNFKPLPPRKKKLSCSKNAL